MFAVIKSGGRQYKVSVGQQLEVNRLPIEDGAQIGFDEVLLISDADTSLVGTPFVENAQVLATALKQVRGEKLIVFRYKSKKRFRHRRGHRQELTVLSIDDIVADGKSLITGEAPRAKEAPAGEAQGAPKAPAAAEEAESDATDTTTGRGTSRRRRTAKVEDTESNTEEE